MTASYQKQRRAAAKAKGYCSTCVTRKAEPGFVTCASCMGKTPGRSHRAEQLPWCGECIAFGHRPGCKKTGTPASFRRVP